MYVYIHTHSALEEWQLELGGSSSLSFFLSLSLSLSLFPRERWRNGNSTLPLKPPLEEWQLKTKVLRTPLEENSTQKF